MKSNVDEATTSPKRSRMLFVAQPPVDHRPAGDHLVGCRDLSLPKEAPTWRRRGDVRCSGHASSSKSGPVVSDVVVGRRPHVRSTTAYPHHGRHVERRTPVSAQPGPRKFVKSASPPVREALRLPQARLLTDRRPRRDRT